MMIKNLSGERPDNKNFILEPLISSEEIERILAKVCDYQLDGNAPTEIATTLVSRSLVEL